jgi:hypothetical protein
MKSNQVLTPAKQAKLEADLAKFIAKHELPCTKVMTGAEWQTREGKWGTDSAVVVTTEDELYDSFNYGEHSHLREGIAKIAKRYGLYVEQGYAWSLHFSRP